MAKNLTLAPNKSITWLTLFAWGFLIIFAGKFVLNDALPYFGWNEEFYGRFLGMKWPLIGHDSGGLLALVLGPFQWSLLPLCFSAGLMKCLRSMNSKISQKSVPL